MIGSILTETQKRVLSTIGRDKNIVRDFYFGGGTVLAEFYLHHRYSEDLDFFSENEVDSTFISVFLKSHKHELEVQKVEYQQLNNRNLYFLYIGDEILKTEFTYFPFPRIEMADKKFNIKIDSLLDIAVNKLFTIYQNVRARDFVDLYFICQKAKYSIDELVKKAKIKFDWHIDPLRLGSQFLKAEEVKDYPRMIIKVKDAEWQNFFKDEAMKLKYNILDD